MTKNTRCVLGESEHLSLFDVRFVPLDQRPVLPIEAVLALLCLPASTLYGLWQRGLGPRRFKIGKRTYVTPRALHEWIERVEGAGSPHAVHSPGLCPPPAPGAPTSLGAWPHSGTAGQHGHADDDA